MSVETEDAILFGEVVQRIIFSLEREFQCRIMHWESGSSCDFLPSSPVFFFFFIGIQTIRIPEFFIIFHLFFCLQKIEHHWKRKLYLLHCQIKYWISSICWGSSPRKSCPSSTRVSNRLLHFIVFLQMANASLFRKLINMRATIGLARVQPNYCDDLREIISSSFCKCFILLAADNNVL